MVIDLNSKSRQKADEAAIWQRLETVMDPEVPALSVIDLAVVRRVELMDDGSVELDVTPTYSGCPAAALINEIIKAAVETMGYDSVTIRTVLSPAWTTDWIGETARQKLKDYGIAPPSGNAPSGKAALFGVDPSVHCPQCDSVNTDRISEFGSTACKAMYRCLDCQEPFEYFKCI